MNYFSDRLIYKADQVIFVDQLLMNRREGRFIFEAQSKETIHRWPAGDIISKSFPNVQYFTVRKQDGHPYSGAMITSHGRSYFCFRNGNNISQYNMGLVDLQTTKLHFRSSISKITNLLKILAASDEEALLLLHQDLDTKSHQILVERLST